MRFVLMCGCAVTASAFAGPVQPFNYLELADSPWLAQPGFAVEDMEDFLFNLPGAMISAGNIIGPGGSTDSVDGDDGAVDGLGQLGHSFFFTGAEGVTITFDPNVIGFVPTRAGAVWTDGTGTTTFEAFDLDGNSLGSVSCNIADQSFNGTTGEDHFFGWEHAGGIGAITLSNGSAIEIDHVQYAAGDVVESCLADCDGNGTLNILDFVCFQGAWLSQSLAGDCDCNGVFNVLDFVCYQGRFQAGCP